MKKMYKAMLMVLCAALLVAGSIMGTLAYLKSETGTIKNTMTVGNVSITLDETPVNVYGEVVEGNRIQATTGTVDANTYKLIPGRAYTKDPIIHVGKESENCWLFVRLVNPIAEIESQDANDGYKTIAEQMTANGWKQLKDAEGNDIQGVYYHEVVSAGANVTVFDHFKIAGSFDGKTTYDPITITAYAIQADGFNTAADAWAATFGKPNTPNP